MKTAMKALTLFVSTAIAGSTYASDAIGPGDSDSRWVLGLSAITFDNIYAGEGSLSGLTPSITYNGDYFFIQDGTFNLALGQSNGFSGGLTANFDGSFLGDDDEYKDNARLAGLKERDYTVEGGFYISHTTELGRMDFTVVTDLGSEHDGQTAAINYTLDLKAGDWYINPVVGLNWISDDKVNHHYGVSAVEATATRAVYRGDSALNAYAGIRGRYEFTQHWDINLEAGVSSLDSSIRDSSIVDADYLYHASATVSYNF